MLEKIHAAFFKLVLILNAWLEKQSVLERTYEYVMYINAPAGKNLAKLLPDTPPDGRKLKEVTIYHITDCLKAPNGNALISDTTFRSAKISFKDQNNQETWQEVPLIDFNPRFTRFNEGDGDGKPVSGLVPILTNSFVKLPEGETFAEETVIAIKFKYYDTDYILVPTEQYRKKIESTIGYK